MQTVFFGIYSLKWYNGNEFYLNKDMSCIIMGIVQCISVVLAVFIKIYQKHYL